MGMDIVCRKQEKKTFRQCGTCRKVLLPPKMGARPARLSKDNRDVGRAACNYSLFTWTILYHSAWQNTICKMGGIFSKNGVKFNKHHILRLSHPNDGLRCRCRGARSRSLRCRCLVRLRCPGHCRCCAPGRHRSHPGNWCWRSGRFRTGRRATGAAGAWSIPPPAGG